MTQHITSCDITVHDEHAAFKAIYSMMFDVDGSLNRSQYAWMNNAVPNNWDNIDDALAAWRFPPERKNGEIVSLRFTGQKVGSEFKMFAEISPFVSGHIELCTEMGETRVFDFGSSEEMEENEEEEIMRNDLITEAIKESKLSKEREAHGKYKEYDVKVVKKKYRDRQEYLWKVAVYFPNNKEISSKAEPRLDAQKAENLFNSLVSRYSLSEE